MHNYFSKIIFSIIILALLFVGCDLVTTRDAEDPITGRSSFKAATTPDQLFSNLKNSFAEQVEKDYQSCFVDSSFLAVKYRFTPSSEAIVKYNILSEWNLDAEKTYFKNLINNVGENKQITVTLEFISNSVDGSGESRNYNYTITVPINTEGLPSLYKGNALFIINWDNNQWVITEWIDHQTEDYPSWSELKGRFYLF